MAGTSPAMTKKASLRENHGTDPNQYAGLPDAAMMWQIGRTRLTMEITR
jgi:hypothetical protein